MISVCIPTYNQGSYIEKCINSILQQSMLPCEIIVSNDCSTDNTKDILDKLAANNHLLKVIHQPVNLGITANTNACLRSAKGDYIVRVDSDDMLCSDYILTLNKLLDTYPAAGYAHCAVQEIDETGKLLQLRRLHRSKVYEDDADALKNSLKGYKVAANIIMFRRKALEQTGFLRCAWNFAEDFYLATDIAAHGFGNVYCAATLAKYRVWKDAGNVRAKRKLEEIKGLTSVFKEVTEPAFRTKNYNQSQIKKAREQFALAQADCLSWKIYTPAEKQILKSALSALSDSTAAKLGFYLYENNLHALPAGLKKLKANIKRLIKNLISHSIANH